MALSGHFQLNPQARSYIPTATAPTLAHRRGKSEEKEGSIGSIRSVPGTKDERGDAGWDGRTHIANPKLEAVKRDIKMKTHIRQVKYKKRTWRISRGGEAE